MKKILIALSSVVLILTACRQVPSREMPSGTATHILTEAPSLTPTATATSILTETPTPSITPLPTIPTFTPTFDVSTIVTVTPAPKAECPKIDPKISVEDYLPHK